MLLKSNWLTKTISFIPHRGKAYTGKDTLARHRKRKEFLDFHLGLYVYNNNSKLNLKAKKFLILIETYQLSGYMIM